jgi:FtsX extracellular domain
MQTSLFTPSSMPVITRLAAIACIATLLATLAVAGWFTQERELQTLSEQIALTVFLEQNATSKDISGLETELRTIAGVDSVLVKSPAIVRSEFVSRFATSISTTLPDNPFPTACIVRLKSEARTKERVDTIAAEIRTLRGVNDVSYRAAFISLVDTRSLEARTVRWVAGVVLVLVLCALLWSAFGGISLAASGLQPPALGIVAGALAGFALSMGVFYACRSTLASLDVVRPISLIAGSVIVCAFGGIILAIQAVLTVKNSSPEAERVTNSPLSDSSPQATSDDAPQAENTQQGGNYEPR